MKVINAFVAKGVAFLSHLCGDEDKTDGVSHWIQFLSHLCGDEALNTKSGLL